MAICKSCGFVSYPSKWKSKEEIFEYYRNSYRKPPNHFNVNTGQRKIHFHLAFLNELFETWRKTGIKKPAIFEVGAASGMALDWFKSMIPGAKVAGSELTTSYKRVCFHEYGIALEDDFDDSKKYDLIMSYKVAEHQLDAHLELRRYAESLKDTGVLYISVPIWFRQMSNFGVPGFDLETYYDPNHVNMWTREIFEGMLRNAGLEIIKEDHFIYDSTYMCKRNDSLIGTPVKHDPEEIKDRMRKIKQAFEFYQDSKFDKAIETWPNFPQAHVSRAEILRAQAIKQGWEWTLQNIIDPGFKACPEAIEIDVMAGDFAMRSERYSEAIKYLETALKKKPENPICLFMLMNVMREMSLRASSNGRVQEALHYMKEARDIAKHVAGVSFQHQREAIDHVYLFSAQIPLPGEA